MSELQPPLRDLMGDTLDEAGVQRIWRGVAERRAPRRSAWLVPAIAAAVLLALVIGWPRLVPSRGPLLLADGREIGALEASAPARVALSDGSAIALSAGARITTLESTASLFSALLAAGRADFSVKPGGPRRWAIECGLVTVEVVGTRFTVDRDAARVRVEVSEGVVLVRGERVPDRVRRLSAGESLEIAEERREPAVQDGVASSPKPRAGSASPIPDSSARLPIAPPASAIAPLPTAPLPTAPASVTAPLPPASAEPRASWRDLMKQGEHKRAYESLGREGLAEQARAASVDDLLALADVARLSGHPADAVGPLQRVVDGHPGDARAGLAAFTLGRVALDSLGRHALAANAFSRALALGVPGALREDASARLVEARARGGDRAGAREAAEAYARAYPNGRHTASVRRWAELETP